MLKLSQNVKVGVTLYSSMHSIRLKDKVFKREMIFFNFSYTCSHLFKTVPSIFDEYKKLAAERVTDCFESENFKQVNTNNSKLN